MLVIRDVIEEDREQIVGMMKEFYHSPACLHSVPDENFHSTITASIHGDNTRVLVLEEQEEGRDNQVIGYANLSICWSNEGGGKFIWFDELYLKKETRGKGYGTKVFRWLETAYPDAKRIRLEVTPHNEKAIALYKRLGYEEFPYYQMCNDRN